jgi:hypothetical protein
MKRFARPLALRGCARFIDPNNSGPVLVPRRKEQNPPSPHRGTRGAGGRGTLSGTLRPRSKRGKSKRRRGHSRGWMPLREITTCNYEYSGRSLLRRRRTRFGGRLRINLSTQGESKSRRDELEEHGETLFARFGQKSLDSFAPLLIRLKRVQDEMHSVLGAVAPPIIDKVTSSQVLSPR